MEVEEKWARMVDMVAEQGVAVCNVTRLMGWRSTGRCRFVDGIERAIKWLRVFLILGRFIFYF